MTCSSYVKSFEEFEQCTLKIGYKTTHVYFFAIVLINSDGNTVWDK